MTRRVARTLFAVSAVTALIALGGCGNAAEQATEAAIETATGGQVEVDVEGDTYTFEDEESGVTVQGGSGTQLPAGFPSDVPLPPSGEIMSATETQDGVSVMWTWNDITQEDFDRYIESIKAAGYAEDSTFVVSDDGPGEFSKSAVLTGNGTSLTVTAFVSQGTGGLTIIALPSP